jgi:hypothetical protein
MCLDPMTMAATQFVIGAASSVVEYQGQVAAHDAQVAMHKANVQNTKTATFDRYDQINKRIVQEGAAKSQELQEAGIEALKARATARTSAAEAGVSGLSVDAILGEMYAKQGRFARNTQVNFDYQTDYWRGEAESARASGQSNINSTVPNPKPSFLPTALKIFGQGVNAAGGYYDRTHP